MEIAITPTFRPLLKVAVALGVTTIIVAVFAATSDFVEAIWAKTRQYEAWEFDELIFAVSAGIAAAFTMAVAQIVSLKKMVAVSQADVAESMSAERGLCDADSIAGLRAREEIEEFLLRLRRSTAIAVDTPLHQLDDPLMIQAREQVLTIDALEWVLGAGPTDRSPLANVAQQ